MKWNVDCEHLHDNRCARRKGGARLLVIFCHALLMSLVIFISFILYPVICLINCIEGGGHDPLDN